MEKNSPSTVQMCKLSFFVLGVLVNKSDTQNAMFKSWKCQLLCQCLPGVIFCYAVVNLPLRHSHLKNSTNSSRCIRIKAKHNLNLPDGKGCKTAGGDTHSFKHSVLCTVALPWNYSSPSDQPCCQVINDVTVQVGHHQNVKLVGILDQLQRPKTRITQDVLGYDYII